MCKIEWQLAIDWKLVIDAVAAAATIGVAAAAVWGDWLRAKLAPPKVELTMLPSSSEGIEVETTGGGVARYYHLKAVNKSPLTVRDCKVVLSGLRKRNSNGEWSEILFLVPFPFIWAGDENGPELAAITTDRVLDFGVLQVGHRDTFMPRLKSGPVAFARYGFVRRGEAMQYDLKVDAQNYWSARPQTLQVSWEGEFPVVTIAGQSPETFATETTTMTVQPSEGVKTRAQIDTEVARGLMLANGGGAVALLAFLPVVFERDLLRPLALPVLYALFTFHLGIVAGLVHSHYRRRCSQVYENHGFRPPPGRVLGFNLREPTVCWASWKWMWASIVLFLAAGVTVFVGALRTILCWH
jgi:hypothetical protein